MISLYPVIAEKLHIPVGKEFKLKPKRGGVYPAQYRFSYLMAVVLLSITQPMRCVQNLSL